MRENILTSMKTRELQKYRLIITQKRTPTHTHYIYYFVLCHFS